MNTVIFDNVNFFFTKTATFIFETPLNDVAIMVAGIAAYAFSPTLAPPLMTIAGVAMLTRIVVSMIGRYNFDLFITINDQLDKKGSHFRSLSYIALIIAVLTGALIPLNGIALGIGIGIYKGMTMELDIQKNKQDSREQESPRNFHSPHAWIIDY